MPPRSTPLACLALATLLASAAVHAEGPESASGAVQQTADRVLAVLQDEALPLEERRQRIQEIAYEQFDFEVIPRLILARHWRRFSPDQRSRFIDEFRDHMILNYGDRIDRYDQEGIEILGERPEARGDVTVRTRVVGGEADATQVDYRLRPRNGRWYVIDVIIEGVSVLKSYRSQFAEILGRGSPEELLRQLREKNQAQQESKGPEPSASQPVASES